ncbi:protein mono-ADP-ribosyltransferase PARP3 isoform X3 [Ursus americanus]|uniref:protein mono-ADP-ribosyltransferase PARP3 isoform X3 n=1 Tax=Ursus americanus TaxID=9643 RepID=UPI001E67A960|nr:protein mono-ADP-ribosyltransferase PARP3 isoform X3 [Ursus americanus]
MAPKRKPQVQHEGPAKKKGRQGAEEEDSFRSTAEALRAAPTEKHIVRVDPACPLSHTPGTQVHEDYACTLNQTNIGSNNNKFYIIQLLEEGDRFACWNRWGRVVDGGPVRTKVQRVRPCSLDTATQKLITNIFSKDMFKNAMTLMNLDVKKMPLGKLSKQQIARGFEALEALEVVLRAPADGSLSLEELSSRFYTVIPHNFGRNRPPPINSPELLQAKKDMLLVLADIELAQTLQASPEEEKVEEAPHPLDRDYQLLKCQLQLLDPEAAEYKGLRRALGLQAAVGLVHTSLRLGTQLLLFLQVIRTYLEQTGNSYRCPALQHVWRVNREGEGDRFQAHSKLGNRRLLWHGTNVAVVAAILTSGLRIMPHSGGRVGKGIYFASENSKSAGYVTGMSCGAHQIGYMFLGEVALGREHHITIDEPSLKQPPPGFDSVIARGHTEPDPTQDTELELDGQRVAVPQGRPVLCEEFSSSQFSQSEYLIYQESQCHLRYLLEVHL